MPTREQTTTTTNSQATNSGNGAVFKKYVGLWVFSTLLTTSPAFANRLERMDRPDVRPQRGMDRLRVNRVDRSPLQNLVNPTSSGTTVRAGDGAVFNWSNQMSVNRGERNRAHTLGEPRRAQWTSKTMQIQDQGRRFNVDKRINLDLSSSRNNIVLGEALLGRNGSSVTITVGEAVKTFGVGSKATAAEYSAILEVLGGAEQSLKLDSDGKAAGGTIDLHTLTNGGGSLRVTNLVIPEQVKAVGNFSNSGEVKLRGDLVNHGEIQALANREGSAVASIQTRNLANEEGGLITSVNQSDLSQSLDLRLRADDTLTNRGRIESSGNLLIEAGSAVNNLGQSASLSARGDVSLTAPSINNTGTISSSASNVNLSAPQTMDLSVNNAGGTISAVNGAINLREAGYDGAGISTIIGGDLLSKTVNLHSGKGETNVDVNQLTGVVSTEGTAAHVRANTESLLLGSQCLTGDPTYYNTGNITIGGNINVGETLAIIAGGNIDTDQTNLVITARSLAGQGFDINLIAGANVTAGSGEVSPAGGPATLPGQTQPTYTENATGDVTFTGVSATGGNIDFSSATSVTINANSTTGNLVGGNVTLAAFRDNTSDTGFINLSGTSTINASAAGSGNNGNVTVIGGADVIIGNINNNVGTGSGADTGNIAIANAQPTTSNAGAITFNKFGAITTGNKIVASSTVATGFGTTAGNINTRGDITITGGNGVAIGTVTGSATATALDIASVAGGVDLSQTSVNSLSATAVGFITLSGDLTAPNGILLVSDNFIFAQTTGVDISTASSTGNAGDIVMVGGANFTQNANQVTITGDSTVGGAVDLAFNAPLTLNSKSTAAGGSGGDITLVGFYGNGTAGGGFVSLDSGLVVTTGGNGAGANGNFTAVGSRPTDYAIRVDSSINTTGGTGAGTGNVILSSADPNTSTAVILSRADATFSQGNFLGGTVATSSSNVDDVTTTTGALSVTAGRDITTSGSISARNGISFIAGRDIYATNSNLSIATTGSGTSGDITMVAGAAFTQTATAVTITGASSTGGVIDFSGTNTITEINSKSTGASGAGGDQTYIAFRNASVPLSGYITLGTTAAISTGGNGGGANGNLIAVAGGAATGVNLEIGGAINATGGLANTGDVTLSTSAPVASPTNIVVQMASAAITAGNPLGGTVQTNSSIDVGNITVSNGGDVTMTAGNFIDAGVVTGGANSVLTATSGGDTTFGNISLGATNVAANGSAFLNGTVTGNSLSVSAIIDIGLSGDITTPGGLALVAGHNIFTSAAGIDLSTASASTSAGDMTIVAGATFSQNATTITISAASATGGAIDFDFFPLSTLTTRSTASNSAGGDVTLVAFRGSDNSGFVSLGPTAPVTTGGTGNGNNGNFIVVSQANSFTGIGIGGTINATGGQAGTGDVHLATTTPDTSPNVVIQRATAVTSGGDFRGGSVQTSRIFVDDITVSNGADITLIAGDTIEADVITGGASSVFTTTSGADTTIGNIALGVTNIASSGSAFLTGTVTGTSLSVSAITDIAIAADISTPGGLALVAGHNIFTSAAGVDLSTASAVTAAGDMTIVAGATFTQDASTITISAASATGGAIDFDFFPISTLTTRSTASNSAGGDVTLVAFRGSNNTGFIALGATAPITTGGTGNGNNGNLIMVAGANSFTGIGMGGTINTTGGLAGTGDVHLATTTPDTTPNVVVQRATAVTSGGDFRGGTAQASRVFVDDITVSNGADITLTAGDDIVTGDITAGGSSILLVTAGQDVVIGATNAGTVTVSAGATVGVGNVINGATGQLTITSGSDLSVQQIDSGAVQLAAGGILFLDNTVKVANGLSATALSDIRINNDITSPVGILLVSGNDITTTVSNVVDISSASTTANAGDITMIAGAAFTQDATTVTISGASGTGGGIDLDFNQTNTLTSRSTALNGVGGDITMVAFRGSENTGFVYAGGMTSPITTGGSGNGANGNLIAVAGASSGAGAGFQSGIDTTGGLAGTGDVHVSTATPDTTPNVVIQKSNASVGGDFRGGTVQNSDVFTGAVTVNNGADITVIAGGAVSGDTFNGGANSVLNISTGGQTLFSSTNLGTVTIDSGASLFIGDILQTATGVINLKSVLDTVIDQTISGTVRIDSGLNLSFTNTLSANSVSATAGKNLNFTNNITAPGGILLVAGRDLASFASGANLSTATVSGSAGDITVIAGADFSQDATTVTIKGASATGGRIDFTASPLTNIDARATAGTGAGGDVSLIAFSGSDNSGWVFTNATTQIRTGGSSTGANGNVTVVAGQATGNSLGIEGPITTTGGSGGQGNVYLATATPDTTPNVTILKSTAAITGGDFKTGALTAGNGFTGVITVGSGATVDILTGGFLSTSGTISGGTNSVLRAQAGSSLDMRTISMGSVTLTAKSFIQLRNNVTAPNGILMVAGTDIFAQGSAISLSSASSTADAGDMTLVAGAAFTQSATDVTINGASTAGGRIDFDTNNTAVLSTSSTFAGGDAGNMNFVAFRGTSNSGEIWTDSTTVISANGNGAGDNGNITMVSGNTGGDGISILGDITISGGAAGTGSISLNTSTPAVPVTVNNLGAITSGVFTGGALSASDIFAGNLTVRGGNITIRSGRHVGVGTLNVSGLTNGAGGTINVSTAGATALQLAAATGANFVAGLNAVGGSTSGKGGTINVTTTGTGGIAVAGLLSVAATDGDGGTINLTATNADVAFSAGTASLLANGGTVTATARAGGTVTLVSNNITGTSSLVTQANGAAGGAGGTVNVTTNGGDITVGTGAGQLQAQANGNNGTINLTANAGGDVIVSNTGSLSASNVNLKSASATIQLNGAVTGSSNVKLEVAGANTITGSATVAGGLLTITAGTGATTLNTTVANLTLATNGNVNLTETDDINVNASTTGAGSFTLNATGDDISVLGLVTANGGINLTTSGTGTITGAGTLASTGQLSLTGGTGVINVATNVASLTTNSTGSITVTEASALTLNSIIANAITVTAATSIAHGTGVIDANSVALTAQGGDIGASANYVVIDNGATPVSLTASATGDIYIKVLGTGSLNMGALTGDDINLDSLVAITTTADTTATGALNITTNSLTNANDLTGNTINIQSQPGSGLTINGGAGGTMTSTQTTITSTQGALNFFGKTNFFGPVDITAVNGVGASVVINTGATVAGNALVQINSPLVVKNGTLTGNPLKFKNDFFTIANSLGDITLGTDVILEGTDFAILAAGNINIAGLTTINLSSPTADGGSLLMVAGYDFTPATLGQVQTNTPFVLTTNKQSTSGGSISLGSINTNLSSANGDAGSFTAIATTGTNAGTITLGNIDASASAGKGGKVLLIGEGGVTVGNINTQGSLGAGTVNIAVAVPNVVGGNITVTNGVVTGTGSFQATTASNGNMQIGAISAPASTVTLTGANAAANTITQTGLLTANTLNVNIGAGTATLNQTAISSLNTTGNGTVDLASTSALTIGTVSSSLDTLTLKVSSQGVITTPAGGISDVANLSLTGTSPTTAINIAGPLSAYNSLTLIAQGGADLTINNLTLNVPNIRLESTAGDFVLTASGVINASQTADIKGATSFQIAGTVTTQVLTLTSQASIVAGAITGTISAPQGMFLTSTAGSIGLDENNRFVTNAAQLLLTAGGGGVYVQSTAASVDVLDVSASTEVDLVAQGKVTIHDVTSGNGDIKIQQNGQGTLLVAQGSKIASNEGDVILINMDLNRKTGKIIIDDDANIKGSGTTAGVGEVFISMGPTPVAPYTTRKAPRNVTVNGPAFVFLGKKGIDTTRETNITLNGLNRDLVFGIGGKLNRRAIHLGSNVVITADPPWDAIPASSARQMIGISSAASNLSIMPQGQSSFATVLDSAQSQSTLQVSTQATTILPTDTLASLDYPSQSGSSVVITETINNDEAISFGSAFESEAALDAILVSETLRDGIAPTTRNAKAGSSSTHNLSSGCAVYAPSKDMVIKTPHSEISIGAQSLVMVISNDDGTAVFDLHDEHKQDVVVRTNGHKVALSPGRHVTVARSRHHNFADANLAQTVLHRGVRSTAIGDAHLFSSEFQIHSVIDAVPLLQAMVTDKDPASRTMTSKLMKTLAVVMTISQGGEEFQQFLKAQMTAMR